MMTTMSNNSSRNIILGLLMAVVVVACNHFTTTDAFVVPRHNNNNNYHHVLQHPNSNIRTPSSPTSTVVLTLSTSHPTISRADDEDDGGRREEEKENEKIQPSSSSSSSSLINCETDLSQIESLTVQTLDGNTIALGEVLGTVEDQQQQTASASVLSCLSHYGDYNAWELTQQYLTAVEEGRIGLGGGGDTDDNDNHSNDCHIVLVGIGSVDSAREFAKDVGLLTNDDDDDSIDGKKTKKKKKITLVTDETGQITDALGCYKGWLTIDQKHKERFQQTDIPPAMKLLGMIFGFGSPGTINKVIDGYVGDWMNHHGLFGRRWVIDALLRGGRQDPGRFPKVPIDDVDVDDDNVPLQPFELATLRLQTGLHILKNWKKLGPKNGDLITRMGGTFVFTKQRQCVWEHFDQGILNFANMDDICQVADAAMKGTRYIPPSNKQLLLNSRRRFCEQKDAEATAKFSEQKRIAKQRRIEEERLAREARIVEETRLEEQSRQEEELIAKIALEGQEAKKQRLAQEEEAQNDTVKPVNDSIDDKTTVVLAAAEETPLVLNDDSELNKEANGVQAPTENVVEDKDRVLKLLSEPTEEDIHFIDSAVPSTNSEIEETEDSLETVISRAVEQERKIRQVLESVSEESSRSTLEIIEDDGSHGSASSSPDEGFQRKLLSASLRYRESKPHHSNEPNPDLSAEIIVEGSTGKEPEVLEERFRRTLLATRLKYDTKKPGVDDHFDSDKAKPEIDTSTLDVTFAGHGSVTTARDEEMFRRRLLAARIGYEKAPKNEPLRGVEEAAEKDGDELFHRNLMAARLRYERRDVNRPSERDHSRPDAETISKTIVAVPQSAVVPDPAML